MLEIYNYVLLLVRLLEYKGWLFFRYEICKIFFCCIELVINGCLFEWLILYFYFEVYNLLYKIKLMFILRIYSFLE